VTTDNIERFPGESRVHLWATRSADRWVPAFAGTADRVRFHPGRVGRRPVANSHVGPESADDGRRTCDWGMDFQKNGGRPGIGCQSTGVLIQLLQEVSLQICCSAAQGNRVLSF